MSSLSEQELQKAVQIAYNSTPTGITLFPLPSTNLQNHTAETVELRPSRVGQSEEIGDVAMG